MIFFIPNYREQGVFQRNLNLDKLGVGKGGGKSGVKSTPS
jgi:hypothetical protein